MSMKKNQFGEVVEEEKPLSVEDWNGRWERGQTRFHVGNVHPTIQKYFDMFFNEGEDKTTTKKRFLVPLCGKTLDMEWLASQGHEVIGVECARLGCEQFYQEHAIPFTALPHPSLPDAHVFQSEDPQKNVKIYCCDLFALTSAELGRIDCIWDRGSFAALDHTTRKRYAEIIQSFMTPQTRYLLTSFKFDDTHFAGPPFRSDEVQIRALYSRCKVELLGERDCLSAWQKEWGLTDFTEQASSVTLLN